MKYSKNSIAVPMLVIVPGIMMSSSRSAMGISTGDSQLSDDRLTAVCNYLAIEQNPIGLETLELREAQQRLDDTMARLPFAREWLAKEQEILDRLRPVVEQGAIAELQLNRQEQQILSVQNEVLRLELEILSSLERMEILREEIVREATRVKLTTQIEATEWCQQ